MIAAPCSARGWAGGPQRAERRTGEGFETFARTAYASKLRQAAIDDQFRSCHERRVIACQEHGRLRDLCSLTEATQRDLRFNRRSGFVKLLIGEPQLDMKWG